MPQRGATDALHCAEQALTRVAVSTVAASTVPVAQARWRAGGQRWLLAAAEAGPRHGGGRGRVDGPEAAGQLAGRRRREGSAGGHRAGQRAVAAAAHGAQVVREAVEQQLEAAGAACPRGGGRGASGQRPSGCRRGLRGDRPPGARARHTSRRYTWYSAFRVSAPTTPHAANQGVPHRAVSSPLEAPVLHQKSVQRVSFFRFC